MKELVGEFLALTGWLGQAASGRGRHVVSRVGAARPVDQLPTRALSQAG